MERKEILSIGESIWRKKVIVRFRRYQIYIRMARQIFRDILKPMCDKCSIELQCIETQYSGHVKDLLTTLDLKVEISMKYHFGGTKWDCGGVRRWTTK